MERHRFEPSEKNFYHLRDDETIPRCESESGEPTAVVRVGSVVHLQWAHIGVEAYVQVVQDMGEQEPGMKPLTVGSALYDVIKNKTASDKIYTIGTLEVIILEVDNSRIAT